MDGNIYSWFLSKFLFALGFLGRWLFKNYPQISIIHSFQAPKKTLIHFVNIFFPFSPKGVSLDDSQLYSSVLNGNFITDKSGMYKADNPTIAW